MLESRFLSTSAIAHQAQIDQYLCLSVCISRCLKSVPENLKMTSNILVFHLKLDSIKFFNLTIRIEWPKLICSICKYINMCNIDMCNICAIFLRNYSEDSPIFFFVDVIICRLQNWSSKQKVLPISFNAIPIITTLLCKMR